MFRVSLPAHGPFRKGFLSSAALALVLAGGGAIGVGALSAPAHAQSEAPKYSKKFAKAAQQVSTDINTVRNSPAVVAEITNLVAASNALQTAKGNDAIAAAQADFNAVGKRIQALTTAQRSELEGLIGQAESGDEKFLVGELMEFLGNFSGDTELRYRALKLKLDSGVLKPEAVPQTWIDVGQYLYTAKRYDEAAKAFASAYQAGKLEGAVYATDAYFLANRPADGLSYLEGVINSRRAAGLDVPQSWYGNGLNHARKLGDLDQTSHWAALYAARGNTPQTWNAGVILLMDSGKFDLQERLDFYRLLARNNALLTSRDYVSYMDAADARSLPNEVLPIVTEAISKGLLATSRTATNSAISNDLIEYTSQTLDLAKQRAPDERKAADKIAAQARTDAKGDNARDAGDVYESFGANAQAEEMFKLALAKGGVDTDRVLTRLGIVQADQGKYAEARANFAKVSGSRKPIAAMWLAYIDSKTAPAPTPAAPTAG